MRRGVWSLGASLACFLLASSLLLVGTVSAQSVGDGQTIAVTAVVAAHRYIILDDRGTISQVISNTREDIVPEVFQGDFNGQRVDYSTPVQNQYSLLKPTIDFSRYGTVYIRTEPKTRSSGGIIASTIKYSRIIGLLNPVWPASRL